MQPQHPGLLRRRTAAVAMIAAALLGAGCKSDLNQQLLERELRYQEDQIYQLQDELAEKCARLDHVAGENASLRRQLGVSESDPAAPARGRRPRTPGVPPAATVPPAIEVPDAAPPAGPRRGGPPVELAPPTLEGVPPLPAEPGGARPTSDGGDGLSLPPRTATHDPAARPIESVAGGGADVDTATAEEPVPALVRMSHAEPASPGRATRLSINAAGGGGIDADGDGRSEGIALAIEPRDEAERLAPIDGEVTVTAHDADAAPSGPPLARWIVADADARSRFRPAGRRRGLFLELPWQGRLPAGEHVRVAVQVATADGPLATEAIVPAR